MCLRSEAWGAAAGDPLDIAESRFQNGLNWQGCGGALRWSGGQAHVLSARICFTVIWRINASTSMRCGPYDIKLPSEARGSLD
jgi:hypothetical protein